MATIQMDADRIEEIAGDLDALLGFCRVAVEHGTAPQCLVRAHFLTIMKQLIAVDEKLSAALMAPTGSGGQATPDGVPASPPPLVA